MRRGNIWTPEMTAALVSWRAQGISASQIAKNFNRDSKKFKLDVTMTKMAILGKMFRMREEAKQKVGLK